jgi:hypothetical protein
MPGLNDGTNNRWYTRPVNAPPDNIIERCFSVFEVKTNVTICPCCGIKSAKTERETLRDACPGCGAYAVGEPLPRPEHELPSFGRSLLLAVTGTLTVIVFLVDAILAFIKIAPPFDLWSVAWSTVAAMETAAWHLKWAMIPFSLLVFFGLRKIYRSVKQSPVSFCGFRHARRGYFASAAVPLLVLVLIGITVPERLHHRRDSIEAGVLAQGHRLDRAMIEYKEKYGTLPSETSSLTRLPDPDGSLALALQNLDPNGYTVDSEVAAAPTKKPRPLRGAVILNASDNTTDEPLSAGISFTSYRLRLPGHDKVLGTDDDLFVSDGVVDKVSNFPPRLVGKTTAAQTRQR